MTEDRTSAGSGGEQDLRDTSSTASPEAARATPDTSETTDPAGEPKATAKTKTKSKKKSKGKTKTEEKVKLTKKQDDPEVTAQPDPEPDPASEPETGPDAEATSAPAGDRVLLRVAAVVALAGLVVAIVGGVLWYRADHDESLQFANTRDEVTVEARQDIATLNSFDSEKPDQGFEAWKSVSGGTLLDNIKSDEDNYRKMMAESNKVAKGQVVDTAITTLDARAGTATVIAAVEVSVTPKPGYRVDDDGQVVPEGGADDSTDAPSQEPSDEPSSSDGSSAEPAQTGVLRHRYQAELTRDSSGSWLVASIEPVQEPTP